MIVRKKSCLAFWVFGVDPVFQNILKCFEGEVGVSDGGPAGSRPVEMMTLQMCPQHLIQVEVPQQYNLNDHQRLHISLNTADLYLGFYLSKQNLRICPNFKSEL